MRVSLADTEREITIKDILEKPSTGGTVRVDVVTSNRRLRGVYHPVDNVEAGVIMLGGAGGGFDGPAGVYPDLAKALIPYKIASIRLDYRLANRLSDCVIDTIIAIQYLHTKGIQDFGVVGWSFGGAVAIMAAAINENVKAIATVATQSQGTEGAAHLEGKHLLLLHGTGDGTLPTACSEQVYQSSNAHKDLKLYPGANHGLDQVRAEMLGELKQFFAHRLVADD